LDQHQSAPLVGEELRVGDLLVGMEPMHMEAIVARGLDKICQSTLLGLWSRPMRPHIYDPMGRSIGYFRTCYTVIDSAVEQILHRIWEQKSERGIGVPTGGGA
jgi:protein-tyrosine phosphatase